MKKRIFSLIALVLLLFQLTGCMRITYHVTLNKNATADVVYEMYMNKETLPLFLGEDVENQDIFAENKKSAENSGFTVEPLETETEVGFKASAKGMDLNMEEVITQLGMGGTGDGGIKVTRGLFRNFYTLTANVDTTDIFGDDPNSQTLLPAINQSIALKLIVTAPSEITSETGTPSETQKNTYEYDIVLGENNQISLSYTLVNMTNIYLIIGAIILAVLIAIYVIKAKKKGVDLNKDEDFDVFDDQRQEENKGE